MVFNPRKYSRPLIFWDAVGNAFWAWSALCLKNGRKSDH